MELKLQPAPTASVGVPQKPGVYFFRSAGDKIIYIGKAANLRARLRSRVFPKETKSVTWEILGSETEALIREAELIKKHRPKYNVLMRDDKQYFFVGFTREFYPKVFVTHQKNREADYIGPFTEWGALRSVLKTLRRAFPYCTCKHPHKRLCLNARIGRCAGYCCSRIQNAKIKMQNDNSKLKIYKKNIAAVKQILSGKNRALARELKRGMHRLSDAREYEEARGIRDQIRALEKIFEHSGVIKQDLSTEFSKAMRAMESLLKINEITRIEAYDIANIHGEFAYGSMAIFTNGKLQNNDYRLFKIRNVHGSNDPAMLKEVLSRRFKHKEWQYPEVVIVDGGRAQLGAALAVAPPSKIIALTKNAKHVGDHIFVSGHREPVPLIQLPSPLKNLILLLDSEAHRFAISHYRRLHRQSLTSLSAHANLNK